MTSLNYGFAILPSWLYKNFMVLKTNQCSSMLFGVKDGFQTDLVSNNVSIKNNKEVKVLGKAFDNKLHLYMYLSSITKKAIIKLNALTRAQKYMTPEQKTFLKLSFIQPQFNYGT